MPRPRTGATARLDVADTDALPLTECPVALASGGDTWAVFMSGDGGWARFERQIAGTLVAAGMPVLGWSALRYFWRRRTPGGVAGDLARIIAAYTMAWRRSRVVLIGFSRGADVLPFAYNRLPRLLRDRVVHLALLGMAAEVSFEYRLRDWLSLGGAAPARAILPELECLPRGRGMCVVGENDAQAASRGALIATGIETIVWPGGHHMDRDHAGLAELILARSKVSAASTRSRRSF